MSKELNIIEAIDMPIETEFNVIFNDGCEAKVILEKTNRGNGKYFEWIKPPKNVFDGETRDSVIAASGFINAKFIQIPKSVSFMEAVESAKYVRVDISNLNGYSEKDKKDFNKPMYLSDMFKALSYLLSSSVREIIEKGKWYIED